MLDNSASKIWQSQPAEANKLRLDQIQTNASKLHDKTRRTLYRHLAAQLFLIACCATGIALAPPSSQRAAFMAALLWALAGLYAVHRGMWSPALPADSALTTSVEYYRGEVERQIILSRRYLGWLFGPLVLFLGSFIVTLVTIAVRDRTPLRNMLPFLTLLVLWFGAVFVLRVRAQRELQREIEQLNRS
jgi:hypothetical protein